MRSLGNCLLGCGAIVAIITSLGCGGLYFYLSKTRTDESESIVERFKEVVEANREKTKNAIVHPSLDFGPVRTWTDTTGRTLEGVLIATESETALIRVLGNQRVYRIPFQRLSPQDRTHLANQATPSNSERFYPAVAPRWPVVLGGPTVTPAIEPLPDGDGWRSANYDFRSREPVDPALVRELAHSCETLHRIAGQTPLPLGWGRPHGERREIQLYTSDHEFGLTGVQENWAAFYNPEDNKIHLPLSSLRPHGSVNDEEYDLARRKNFKVLIHELAHQESVSLMAIGCPPWATEGIAELFSAMQRAPGTFVFSNAQTSVRRQFYEQSGLGDGGKLTRLPVPKLDTFLDLPLRGFNAMTAKSAGSSISYYAGSLMLVDYFCFADANSLRAYLEAIATGVPPRESAKVHLLRGRSLEEIESAIVSRWKSQGLDVVFSSEPEVSPSDFKAKVGFH